MPEDMQQRDVHTVYTVCTSEIHAPGRRLARESICTSRLLDRSDRLPLPSGRTFLPRTHWTNNKSRKSMRWSASGQCIRYCNSKGLDILDSHAIDRLVGS